MPLSSSIMFESMTCSSIIQLLAASNAIQIDSKAKTHLQFTNDPEKRKIYEWQC